ncbi:nickel pincer cofactor biosynthesis protein LarB [Afipia sp. 1NLS2]|uniref:nickel pincer cofactor biosynthesis protein LarB n=1 Tax=Afipia sp. 1NLS2 TaxID=666684 RepID=UPI0001D9F9F7|nr:nickel pincer cofactor biosynthesis protein LarB [Afipia sp. 1NLS2]EFI50878.1 1-(5-phosphoribosyl)-5-amino-4-imidazole-carboxylate (AIR) carboxylase [Afipia sp. 1NLS2]
MLSDQVKLDFQRRERIGFDEAVLCEWKSVEQIAYILQTAIETKNPLLLTRLTDIKLAALPEMQRKNIDYDPVSRTGFFAAELFIPAHAEVSVVSAGSSDIPVAHEAIRTLQYFGIGASEISDVGVAGLWRLMERLEGIRASKVIIVAAGMDGALPSVVGGLVPGSVIAVPTSVGYGASDSGRTAMNACLASCAAGLAVVNIDNGFGAACVALRVLRDTKAPQYRMLFEAAQGVNLSK